jgi:hypothetical protein
MLLTIRSRDSHPRPRVELITQRSKVQILPPQPIFSASYNVYCGLVGFVLTIRRRWIHVRVTGRCKQGRYCSTRQSRLLTRKAPDVSFALPGPRIASSKPAPAARESCTFRGNNLQQFRQPHELEVLAGAISGGQVRSPHHFQ